MLNDIERAHSPTNQTAKTFDNEEEFSNPGNHSSQSDRFCTDTVKVRLVILRPFNDFHVRFLGGFHFLMFVHVVKDEKK